MTSLTHAYIDAYFAYRGYPGEEGGAMKATSARDREGAGTGDEGEREGESCVKCRDEG